MYAIRKQYQPPTRVWITVALVGVVSAVVGLALSSLLNRKIEDRISAGDVVVGQISSVSVIPLGKFDPPVRVGVRYAFNGAPRRAELWAASSSGRYTEGRQVDLFLDPAHPTRIATRDGLASDGWLVLAPPGMVVIGSFAVIASLVAAWRWWRRYWRLTPSPVPALAADVILGESHLMTPWARSATKIVEAIQEVGASVQSPLKLWVVFLAKGEGVQPGFDGIRAACFFTRQRRLVVEAVLAKDRDGQGLRHSMLELLRQAIDEAEDFARGRKIAAQLNAIREVYDSLAAGGRPGSR